MAAMVSAGAAGGIGEAYTQTAPGLKRIFEPLRRAVPGVLPKVENEGT